MINSLEKLIESKGKKFLFKVESSAFHKDYLKYEELRNEIWDFSEDCLPGSRNLMCKNYFHDGSSLFIAVYRETEGGGFSKQDREHLIGFSYGFVGVKDKKIGFRSIDNIQFYSQYTGVSEGYQSYGLGILIKEFQRDKLMDIFGVYTVTCTYDPLTGINAYRNIHYFGMEIGDYRTDIYGEFGGRLSREDIPSDRFVISWDLQKEIQRPSYDLELLLEAEQIVTRVEYLKIQGKNGPTELEVLKSIDLSLENEILLVEIPLDIYLILNETDVKDINVRKIPLEWREKTREIFQTLFDRNYSVFDFRHIEKNNRKRNFYILKK